MQWWEDDNEFVPGSDRDELVGIVDETGHVVDATLRSRMRSENLRHAATAILVRNSAGQIFVHQRSREKDWRPGHFDAANGGVVLLGEVPHESALRELNEELGITDVVLRPLGSSLYEDESVRVFEWVYEVTWDGPMDFKDEEVVWGRWMSLDGLRAKLADPTWLFMPDTRALFEHLAADGVGDY